MATRQSQKLASSSQKAAYGPRNRLSIEALLEFLVRPLPLPVFDVSGFAYNNELVDSIQQLLLKALSKSPMILPSKVTAIQFIFARRSKKHRNHVEKVVGDFSFPLLLRCKNLEEAVGIADGMSYVTDYLSGRKSSFHVRIRSNSLTYSPAVCVFSTSRPDHIHDVEHKSTTVLWVQLDSDRGHTDEIRYPTNLIEDLGRRPINGRKLFKADIQAAIDGMYFHESKKFSGPLTRPSAKAGSNVGLIHESNLTDDARSKRLQKLREGLGSDAEYLRRVSYLLKFGDVILCTPHAYDDDARLNHPENPVNPHEMITDAGLTVIVDPSEGPITEDDWLRIQVVAQKLAIFAGAAMSTATEARESILKTLHRGFNHEFRNAVLSVLGSLRSLRDEGGRALLSAADISDIDGRLQFTKLYLASAMEMYKRDHRHLKPILDDLVTELKKHRDITVAANYKLAETEIVMGLWQPVLIEVLRNSIKHSALVGSPARKSLSVSAVTQGCECVVEVSNLVTDAEYKRSIELGIDLDNEPEGWPLIHDMATFLKGECKARVSGDVVTIAVRMPLVETIGDFDV